MKLIFLEVTRTLFCLIHYRQQYQRRLLAAFLDGIDASAIWYIVMDFSLKKTTWLLREICIYG
jgi:hypothetical protein